MVVDDLLDVSSVVFSLALSFVVLVVVVAVDASRSSACPALSRLYPGQLQCQM